MSNTKIILADNGKTIGTLSPYSYQVKGKAGFTAKQIEYKGELRSTRLTKGQGKGQATRYYIYFMEGDFQHWVELTEAAHTELTKNPASVLKLEAAAPSAEAPAAAAEAPAAAAEAPKKSKKAKRDEAVAA